MASRQLPKSRNDQTVMIGLKGEAGQAQLITTAVDATHGMHVSADVEQNAVVLGRLFWFMAEPQPSKTLGSLLGQAFNHAVCRGLPPIQSTSASIRSGNALKTSRRCWVRPSREWIRSPRMTSLGFQWWQSASRGFKVPASPSLGMGMPWTWEAFRFAKVEISHHQHPSVLSPERSLRKKTEGLLIPCPDEWISHGHRAQRCDDCATVRPSGGFSWQMRPCRCVTCF